MACESEASRTTRERSRGEEEEQEGFVVAADAAVDVVAAVVVVVVDAGTGSKALSSRTGASRSCCKLLSCCSRLRPLLFRGMETRAKAETMLGGSGRLEGPGVGVEGPVAAALDGRCSMPLASPSTPPMLPFPLLVFFFSLFFVDDVSSCFSI